MNSSTARRFLDDQVWFENRRVIDLLRDIEARALALRDERAVDLAVELDASAPEVRLPMERPLCTPVRKPRIDSSPVRPAGSDDEIDPSALFEQVYVDPDLLRGNVRAALRRRLRIGLADLIIEELLVHGLAELVTYLSLSLAVGKPSPYARSSSTGSAPAALFTGSGAVEAGCKAANGRRCRGAGNLGKIARRAECPTIVIR